MLDDGLERALKGLGAEYDRQCTQDADLLWWKLRDTVQARPGHRPVQRWQAAAAALVAILLCAGGLEHLLAPRPQPVPPVNLTFMPPGMPLRVAYVVRSSFRDVLGPSGPGKTHETVSTIRSEQQITEAVTPKSQGGYVLTVRIDAKSASGNGPLVPENPPGTPAPVLTYDVGPSGRVLKASATPASAEAMLYKGKAVSAALMPGLPVPDRRLEPGDTWTVSPAGAAPGTKATYVYEGVVHGLLKIHLSGVTKLTGGTLGETGTETTVGNDYLDPTTHLVDSTSWRAVFTGTRTLPASGSEPASTAPDRSVLQMTWRRIH